MNKSIRFIIENKLSYFRNVHDIVVLQHSITSIGNQNHLNYELNTLIPNLLCSMAVKKLRFIKATRN